MHLKQLNVSKSVNEETPGLFLWFNTVKKQSFGSVNRNNGMKIMSFITKFAT